MTSWPGNPKVLVVVEPGSRRVTYWDLSTPGVPNHNIIDLSGVAWLPTSVSNDFLGVTGCAFHPQFLTDPAKRLFYVRYNVSTVPPTTIIEQYTILPGSLKVDPSTAVLIYSAPTSVTGHGSGTLQFARPTTGFAKLYVPMPDDADVDMTDSGICCDAARVQDVPAGSDFGDLITIDVDASPPITWNSATGFRNPFGFSVDSGQAGTGHGKGDVWIGDTGWLNTGSVIRWTPSGAFRNYGWPWKTGDGGVPWAMGPDTMTTVCGIPTPPATPGPCNEPLNPPTYSLPYIVFSDFDEFGLGARDALIGGYVYRQSTVPSLTDQYVFATYGVLGPNVYSLPATGGAGVAPVKLTNTLGVSSWPGGSFIHSLGEDAKGELYVVRVDQNVSITSNGAVFKITP